MRININVFVSVRVSVWCLVLGVTLPTLLGITYTQTIFAFVQYFIFVPWSTVKLLNLHTHREGTSFALASFLIGSSVLSAHAPSATNSRGARFLPTCTRPVFVTTSQGSNVTSWRLTYPAEARRSWANADPAKHKSMCHLLTLGIIMQLYELSRQGITPTLCIHSRPGIVARTRLSKFVAELWVSFFEWTNWIIWAWINPQLLLHCTRA